MPLAFEMNAIKKITKLIIVYDFLFVCLFSLPLSMSLVFACFFACLIDNAENKSVECNCTATRGTATRASSVRCSSGSMPHRRHVTSRRAAADCGATPPTPPTPLTHRAPCATAHQASPASSYRGSTTSICPAVATTRRRSSIPAIYPAKCKRRRRPTRRPFNSFPILFTPVSCAAH